MGDLYMPGLFRLVKSSALQRFLSYDDQKDANLSHLSISASKPASAQPRASTRHLHVAAHLLTARPRIFHHCARDSKLGTSDHHTHLHCRLNTSRLNFFSTREEGKGDHFGHLSLQIECYILNCKTEVTCAEALVLKCLEFHV